MKDKMNKIHNTDCLEFMKQVPDNYFDLILTDPPYGDNFGYGRNNKEILGNENVDINFLAINEFQRIAKNDTSIYVFSNWKYELDIRNFVKNETDLKVRNLIVLVKNNFGMGYGFRNQHEVCIVLEKGNPKYKLGNFSNVIKMRHIQHTGDSHPHMKDVDVFSKIIEHSNPENGKVFDAFMGSGTTAVACKSKGIDFCGCELDKKYYDLANKRLKQVQGSLF